MIKYRVGHELAIVPVEVVRETEKFIVQVDGRGREVRIAKNGRYSIYFDTWEEAHEYLLDKYTKLVERGRVQLAHNEDALAAVKRTVKP